MKLTKYTHNPIAEIERAFDGFFNLTPVFHQLEEVYKTGDQVRFASDEKALGVQIDLPGVTKDNLDLSTDTDQREVYIKAKRKIIAHDGEKEQTYNRSFSVGREFDLNKINFLYVNGVLEVEVPRRKKEEYIKTYKV
jgi:HSP20 family molecular chaperone IbpA|tara:strand:- start:420 stop:830 length:411 start_codon:yes stop_codon:yes gene_type:complete